MMGDDFDEAPVPHPARSSNSLPRPPVWQPPKVEPVPRLEDLKKGAKVYRRGMLSEVVKIDFEADPPALVVRMLEGGHEVGTDAANVSLSKDMSARCLAAKVRVLLMDLQ